MLTPIHVAAHAEVDFDEEKAGGTAWGIEIDASPINSWRNMRTSPQIQDQCIKRQQRIVDEDSTQISKDAHRNVQATALCELYLLELDPSFDPDVECTWEELREQCARIWATVPNSPRWYE